MTLNARPYFSYKIAELEALFKAHIDDVAILAEVQRELSHRKTPSALRLLEKVEAQRALKKSSPSGPDVIPPRNAIDPPPASKPDSIEVSPSLKPVRYESINSIVRQSPALPITDTPDGILSSWIAMEVLSPQAFVKPEELASGDRSRIAPITGAVLPWERGERSRPNYRLYYQVVLGTIALEPAMEQLTERYADLRIERPGVRGRAAMALVVLDSKGCLVELTAIGISSFPWGVVTALRGELGDLAGWPDAEPKLVKAVEKALLDSNSDGKDDGHKKVPISRLSLNRAYQALIGQLGVPEGWTEPPEFAIRSYAYFKDPTAPEPLLLNSFFLQDLAEARRLCAENMAPVNLLRYLGAVRPSKAVDLLHNHSSLEQAVQPSLTPLARWPGPDRHSLVLLQQAAVNLAFSETINGGVLGVNGPPGTGKTTLLRDIVAGVVAARAEKLAAFDDPEVAFEHSGQKLKAGNGWLHLYRVNEDLRGYEMVVASSNNKAVENVSAELPELNAIAEDADGLRYFKTLSDAFRQTNTWGAIAAVLGNAQNRGRFKQTFWWDEDSGMSSYLFAATGGPREVEITDSDTGKIERRVPKIIQAENPPLNRDVALCHWAEARKRFNAALAKSRQWQQWLDAVRDDLTRIDTLAASEIAATHQLELAKTGLQKAKTAAIRARDDEFVVSQQSKSAHAAVHSHQMNRPGFWSRLFRTQRAQAWAAIALMLSQKASVAGVALKAAAKEFARCEEWCIQTSSEKAAAEREAEKAAKEHQTALRRLSDARQKYGVLFADSDFFGLSHNDVHQSTPWYPKVAQRVRDEVFVAAMELHRAFIDAAAKPLRHNLGALMSVFTTQSLPDAQKQALLVDLWTSLFLVIPLVSTTFASVQRMLGRIPVGGFGWLFIDEAGQALPQAAVGAIMRSKRAVIVGDPIQIEPVVVLPETLTHAMCRRFGVDPDKYAAPSASVQTLADSASSFMCEFQTASGSRTVGVPLLVHRRCAEPMFGISNAIAYSGQMVAAKPAKHSEIRDALGPSRWIHTEGSGDDKWCDAEGDEVIKLLQRLARGRIAPNLYIVTPFVIVADRLRHLIRNSGILKGWIDDDPWQWTAQRIGTVHTVQGREAEAVIFVLGAPMPAQTGARQWAGGRPNLLNVAVTRAKEALYVVGNRELWRVAGFFVELDKRLR
ncbi:DEAD/DEAH box helicase [Prosthecobacter sp.]|uniref:DEAD/DEAH box helicase n=1 Tax=Prosthecobacter sp. TaxID=1965333 RepID=UPI0037830457